MLDYYQILGISRTSQLTDIKSAFKKLALQYHPDRNPNNTAAEEYFKQVNEAYQVLSNPEQRKRYDFLLTYSFQSTSSTQPNYKTTYSKPHPHRPPWQTEKSVYDRYGKFNWKNTPKYKKAPAYRFDKNYLKIQAITLLSIVIIALAVIGTTNYLDYIEKKEQAAIDQENEKLLRKAHSLFETGKYRQAISTVETLSTKYPVEFEFYEAREQMVASLFSVAATNFENNKYLQAVNQLEIVKDFERPMKMDTWSMLADSHYALGQYNKAVHAYAHIFSRDKFNIRLATKIGDIYYENLNMTAKALEYFDEAKLLFKEFQRSSYGNAFELLVQPDLLPDFYHVLFVKRARLNTEAGNLEEAVTDCNWAIFLRPHIAETYFSRANCYWELNQPYRACKDWQRGAERGHEESAKQIKIHCTGII